MVLLSLLCGKTYAQDPKHPKQSDCHYASTFEIRNTNLHNCLQQIDEHRDDKFVLQVQRRLYSCIDFVAAEARYHAGCYTRFSARKQARNLKPEKLGERIMKKMNLLFKQICMWLENSVNASIMHFKHLGGKYLKYT